MTVYRMRPRPIETDFMVYIPHGRDNIDEIKTWMESFGCEDIKFVVVREATPEEQGIDRCEYRFAGKAAIYSFPVHYGDFIARSSAGLWRALDRYTDVPNSEWTWFNPADALTDDERDEGWLGFGTYMAGVPDYVAIECTKRYDEGGLPVGERIDWEQTRSNIIAQAVLGAMDHLAERDRHE